MAPAVMDSKQMPDQVIILVRMMQQGDEILPYSQSRRQGIYVSGLRALTSSYHGESPML